MVTNKERLRVAQRSPCHLVPITAVVDMGSGSRLSRACGLDLSSVLWPGSSYRSTGLLQSRKSMGGETQFLGQVMQEAKPVRDCQYLISQSHTWWRRAGGG